MAVLHSGNDVGSINEVKLRQAQLALELWNLWQIYHPGTIHPDHSAWPSLHG